MEMLRDVAVHLSSGIAEMGPFEVVSPGTAIPVLAFKVKDPELFTAFHVSDHLRMTGWQVPAYTMPENATDVAVLRVVVREGFGMDFADSLLAELQKTVAHLTAHPPVHTPIADGFSHT
jgi:glutamate decarboxylase